MDIRGRMKVDGGSGSVPCGLLGFLHPAPYLQA